MCAGVSSDGANTQEITGIPALSISKNIDQLVGTDKVAGIPLSQSTWPHQAVVIYK